MFDELVSNLLAPRQCSAAHETAKKHESKRFAAVMALISDQPEPDLLFTERSSKLNNHAGQISFPGGSKDPADGNPLVTALRETDEEIGLGSELVEPLGALPAGDVPVSSFHVCPIVGLWSGFETLTPNLAEVKAVYRWKIEDLRNPNNRVTWALGGRLGGPAWVFGELFLWGFTAGVVDAILKAGGWSQPWDDGRVMEVPERFGHPRASRRS